MGIDPVPDPCNLGRLYPIGLDTQSRRVIRHGDDLVDVTAGVTKQPTGLPAVADPLSMPRVDDDWYACPSRCDGRIQMRIGIVRMNDVVRTGREMTAHLVDAADATAGHSRCPLEDLSETSRLANLLRKTAAAVQRQEFQFAAASVMMPRQIGEQSFQSAGPQGQTDMAHPQRPASPETTMRSMRAGFACDGRCRGHVSAGEGGGIGQD